MILYSSNAIEFKTSVDNNTIADKIEESYTNVFGRFPGRSEKQSWNNSLQFMGNIVRNSQVADDCGVLIEFTLPPSSKRVDFIISGQNKKRENNCVIVELKQWDAAQATDREDIVTAFVGGRNRDVTHPSYQAWSYKQMLDDMNSAFYQNSISSYACSYLHNYSEKTPEPLKSPQYNNIINITPMFLRHDTEKLQTFIKEHVGSGKGMDILYKIENGEIKPSKKLIDYVASLFQGNNEFVLLDEQKVAHSTIINIAKQANEKSTIIVKGGPGTGKSVISLNSFYQLITAGKNIKFIAPNAAFRSVVLEHLTKNTNHGRGRISHLFSGSSQFVHSQTDTFDILIVDEAHRLKDGNAYMYQGDNQVEDIIKASKVNVFFVDDAQRIRPEDIGTSSEIKRVASQYNSKVYELDLQAQFRCIGAEGFINWIDTVLQIKETGNYNGWDKNLFDFNIIDNPNELWRVISTKNSNGSTARIVAGYAWKWTSEKQGNRNGEISDVIIPEHNFSMPWNSRANREMWAIRPEGLNQIGCIHTSQGLEFDYIGVIIGKDLKFDPVRKSVFASYNDYEDTPGKKGLRNNQEKLNSLVSNVYRTLISRGMKGCYIYCVDSNLQEHFKERLQKACYSNNQVK